MKDKKEQKGFSSFEFLVVILLAACLLAIILLTILDVANKEKYKIMQKNATLFGYNQGAYSLSSQDDIIYLQTLIEHHLSTNIENPFEGEKYCDKYESKITLKEEKRYIYLKCGNYVIDQEYTTDQKYNIYKVGDWTEEKLKKAIGHEIEHEKVYNYQVEGKTIFEKYFPEDVFLLLMNKKDRTKYQSVEEVKKTYEVITKDYYRTKELVD